MTIRSEVLVSLQVITSRLHLIVHGLTAISVYRANGLGLGLGV